MSEIGTILLGIGFVAAVTAVMCAVAAWYLQKSGDSRSIRAWKTGSVALLFIAGTLTIAVILLAWCFSSGDLSLLYVAYSHPQDGSGERWFSRISAVWAGKSGSLLVWAWLVSIWACPIAMRSARKGSCFEGAASGVVSVVLLCLVGMMLFSSDNMPFWPTPTELLDDSGNLVAAASGWGMSSTLDHWAMDIHPFMLLAGYAGFTIPFALSASFALGYGEERAWRKASSCTVLLAWVFMTSAIILGAVWANSTPGWSGYWSWDAVETASLAPWSMGVAAVVAFAFGRRYCRSLKFAALFSTLAFAGVMLCAFVTRSGVIATIHGYAGDSASAWMFAIMAIASMVIAVVVWRLEAHQSMPECFKS